MLKITPVVRETVPALYALILEAADECSGRTEVTTTVERLLEDGFGPTPRYLALLATDGDIPVGFALYYPMYSAWKGRRTLYLEDLYVVVPQRHLGVGTQLFRELEALALQSGSNLAWEADRDNLRLRHYFVGMGAIDRSHKVSFYMEDLEMRAHQT